jgi:hypothetical protein
MEPSVNKIITKLSKNKVELNKTKAFKSKVDKLETKFKSALKRNIDINDSLRKNISEFNQLEGDFMKMESDVDRIKKAFADLGVELDANTDMYISKVDIRLRAIKKIMSNSIKGQQAFK